MVTTQGMLVEFLDLERIESTSSEGAAPTRTCSGSSAARWPARLSSPPGGPCRRIVQGQTTAGIGASYRAPFRVLELANPTRVVVGLKTRQRIDDGGLPGGSRALTVTPSSGPVGTKVTVAGSNCNPGSASARTYLEFQSGEGGTVGGVGLGEVPTDRQGRFRTTVTVPAHLDPLQDIGGGPTRPGTYHFTTRPPACAGSFTVTSSSPGPIGPPGTLPFTGSRTPLLLAVGSALLLTGAGLVLLGRRRTRLSP